MLRKFDTEKYMCNIILLVNNFRHFGQHWAKSNLEWRKMFISLQSGVSGF